MSILKEILDWSQTIPDWQSDAIVRLLSKPELTEEDFVDLFALLKLEHGIPDPNGRTPTKLTAAHIPAPPNAHPPVQLVAIKDLRHVNAIAEKHRLSFGPSGLSVIYGSNGSGKSGYTRVLKRACRARDQTEPIHPDANQPAEPGAKAEATFEVNVGGRAKELAWTDGSETPPELSTLSIFDSRCAHSYLEKEDDFSYVPYGLDILDRLAKICQLLKGRVDAEIKKSSVDLTTFDSLAGETEVGKLIAGLSAKTDPSAIEGLTTFTEEETTEHAKLSKILKETDPKEKAQQLRLRYRRIGALAIATKEKGEWVSIAAVDKLRELVKNCRQTKAAAKIAAEKFNESENLLPGTGGVAWRAMFDAARKFVEETQPEEVISQLEADTPCPLCQEPLADGARRLSKFDAFIQEEAEKAADTARAALNAEYQPFVQRDLTLNVDDVTLGEIEAIDKALATDTRAFETALAERHKAVQEALESDEWAGIEQPLVTPSERLQTLANKLKEEADALEKVADEEKRAALQKQLAELEARIALKRMKIAVLKAVSKLAHVDKLTKCASALKTNAISLKATDLAAKVVSKDLEDALNAEFKKLGVGSLQVTLTSRTEKGRAVHKLKLNLPQNINPREILSEGEQRAIALGSFLAEVGLSGGAGGVVFDDPMSSLDHRRRDKVARRLVSEASQRQVIVFTHDIYFLCLLADEASRTSVDTTTKSIVRRPEGFGVADDQLPFEGMNTKQRLGYLKNLQVQVAKLERTGDEEKHRKATVEAYRLLRDAWERGVEEVLFQGVVQRFQKGVSTQKLDRVTVEDHDHVAIDAGMTKCSNYSHDNATAGGVSVPDADELLIDIKALEEWRTAVAARSNETQKRRKA